MAGKTLQGSQQADRPPDAEGVRAFLLANPGFLAEFIDTHPETLAALAGLPAERPDGAVDLRGFLVGKLRGEVDGLKRQQHAIVTASRANQNTQDRVHRAVLHLLDAESFEQLIQVISTDLPVMLDLDVACLVVETDGRNCGQPCPPGVRLAPPGTVADALDGKDIRLEPVIEGDPRLFGPGSGLVESQALVRIHVNATTPPALLALGSRDPQMFDPGMRSDLVTFLAHVLGTCLRAWLARGR
ncbi:MAG: DUF484 family protein [Rhodospirillaceae bacterium]|nr:DUF484 family protein [Rhodospirillaceae bacterium]